MGKHYAGADWLKHNKKPGEVSNFGCQVADLLGYVFEGIYHIDDEVLRADFSGEHRVHVVIRKSVSTYDFSELTRLVFLAHWMAIRLEIAPASPRHLRLKFSKRSRTGDWSEVHPSLDEAVEKFKQLCGIDEVK
jgi:hypothetical protein